MTSEQGAGWQQDFSDWIMRTTSSIDDAVDAGIRRLRKRFGRAGTPKIQPYMGYASKDTIRLHGRVLTNPPINADFKTDQWWQNLANTIQRFASDEVPGVEITAFADGMNGSTMSDAEGYFHVDIPRKSGRGDALFWSPARLRIEGRSDVLSESSTTSCEVMYVAPEARFGIISDVDDTILHTGATDIATMAKLTFFGNARTRAPLDGVAKLYEMLQHQGDLSSGPVNPIFYISSSPWNLYDLLDDFLDLNAIPKGPLLLRDLGFDENKFLKSGHDHKLVKARNLMNLFGELPFVLFGDSGQEDARLYATAAEEFGPRIKAIFIRDVDPGVESSHDQNVNQCIAMSGKAGVPMYLVDDSTEAATLAIRHGLLPPDAFDEIALATDRDRHRQAGLLSP